MYADFIYPEYEVVRNYQRCIACRACERQCANEVHRYDADEQMMTADDAKCVNCHRCVSLCPTRALKIVRTDHTFKENANWTKDNIQNVYRQAATGGVLLSSMGNPEPLPGYWDHILINASQVTNPPIDPLREPMETRVFLGKKDMEIRRDENGAIVPKKTPHIELAVPILFSAMSYGSISYNAHESLARAATELGVCYNTGEGGLHEDFYRYGPNTIVQVASGRFGVHSEYLNAGAAVEIKMGQGAKPGIGGHLPGAKIVGDVARTRMVPEGADAISPAPHHDIYSIEDLRQLVNSLKEATHYEKPIIVKIAAVHNVAAIASGIARSGADIIAIDGFRGGTGAAPTRIRDNVGSPHRACAGGCGFPPAGGGHPRRCEPGGGRLHPLIGGRCQSRGAGSGCGIYRYQRTAGIGVPPVPDLPVGPLQLGHRHPEAGPCQAAEPGPGRRAAGEPRHRLAA